MPLPRVIRAILAEAYELREEDVEQDAITVRTWGGTEGALLAAFDLRHGWTSAEEYSTNYLADLRQALGQSA
jgi:hypothetical protein